MHIKHRKGNIPLWVGVAVLLLLTVVTYQQNPGVATENFKQKLQTFDLGYSSPPGFGQVLGDLDKLLLNNLLGSDKRPALDRIDIDIPIIEYQKILQDRETALKRGGLINPTDVRVRIRHKGHTYKAKLRLKGDLPDHWTSEYRMSFRVSLKGGKSVLGFRKFSLHKPLSRQYPFDHLYTETVREMGNLAPPHNYINVYVNGQDWGVMDIEEHISKELLEKQRRKESFIVRFGNEQKSMMYYRLGDHQKYNAYRFSDPKLYQKVYDVDQQTGNPLKRRQISYIAQQRLKPNHADLYDTMAYGRALVLAAIWNDAHPLFRSNSRHYFNPYTLKLEPITADSFHPLSILDKAYLPRKSFDPFTNNLVYRQLAGSEQYRASVDDLLDDVTEVISTVKQNTPRIQAYFPLDEPVDIFPLLEQNAQIVRRNKQACLLPVVPDASATEEQLNSRQAAPGVPQHVRVFHRNNGRIELYNLVADNVTLEGIGIDGQFDKVNFNLPAYQPNLFLPVSLNSEHVGDYSHRLQVKTSYAGQSGLATSAQTLSQYDYVVPQFPERRQHPAPTQQQIEKFTDILQVRHFSSGRFDVYNLLDEPVELTGIYLNGKNLLHKTRVIPGYTMKEFSALSINTELKGVFDEQISFTASYAGNVFESRVDITLDDDDLFNPLMPGKENSPPGFMKRTGEQQWQIERGRWEISRPVTIDGDLKIEPGTQLLFSENAYLIVKGSLHAVGTKALPISFGPMKQQWKGLYIVRAASSSKLVNVSVENTRGLTDGLLSLTGGVTFYQSDVDIKNLHLSGSSAEDSLNLVESKFTIDSVQVNNARSDGIDFDYSDGAVQQSTFTSIGGDALDFSGSEVQLDDVTFHGVHDKAISAGEASHVHVNKLTISEVGVGLACKDGSSVSGKDIDMGAFHLSAVMSYMKKSFYALPSVDLVGVNLKSADNAFFRQKDTQMMINGNVIREQQIDVDKLYKTETMAK